MDQILEMSSAMVEGRLDGDFQEYTSKPVDTMVAVEIRSPLRERNLMVFGVVYLSEILQLTLPHVRSFGDPVKIRRRPTVHVWWDVGGKIRGEGL
jgi:hypothetical protein